MNSLYKYKHHISLAVFAGGFIFDNIALRHADFPVVKWALLGYLAFTGVAIIIFNLRQRQWLLYLIQFSFGSLFSGFSILFFYSSPIIISWPFLVILFLAFLSSEFGKRHYLRFSFQLVVFYLALYCFLILFVPIVVGELSARIFLLSGVTSLVVMAGLLAIAARVLPKLFAPSRKRLLWGIVGVFITVNVFYFTNILPPIPLVLKESGVYHSIARSGNNFLAGDEQLAWWQTFHLHSTIHLITGESAYFYAAVFAPTEIKTGIVHHWEYFDEPAGAWISQHKVRIPIAGGREAGFRSYSLKAAPAPGWWRVSVETDRGQVIGRQKFQVEQVTSRPTLKTEAL